MGWQWLYILYYLQVVQWQTCTQANIYILESTVSMFMSSDSYDMPFSGWASEKSTGNGTCMNSSTSKAEGPCGIASLRRLKFFVVPKPVWEECWLLAQHCSTLSQTGSIYLIWSYEYHMFLNLQFGSVKVFHILHGFYMWAWRVSRKLCKLSVAG